MFETEMSASEESHEILTRVAWYYYHDGLTQHAIGEKLGLPRIKVSRLLESGRRSGLLQVRINSPLQGCLDVERRLQARFQLDDVRVIPKLEDAPRAERLGQAAAQYLMQQLSQDGLLAVGWGEMVGCAIQRLGHLSNERSVDLVSMAGGIQTYVDGLRLLAAPRRTYLVPAPLIVDDPVTATALRKDTAVRNTLQMSLRADFALVGIGALEESASVFRHGYIHPTELQGMRRQGAVGDVLCRFIDANGQELPLPVHDRVIGLSLAELKRVPRVIAAAAGVDKLAAIRAVLKGEFINIFITDEPTAEALLT